MGERQAGHHGACTVQRSLRGPPLGPPLVIATCSLCPQQSATGGARKGEWGDSAFLLLLQQRAGVRNDLCSSRHSPRAQCDVPRDLHHERLVKRQRLQKQRIVQRATRTELLNDNRTAVNDAAAVGCDDTRVVQVCEELQIGPVEVNRIGWVAWASGESPCNRSSWSGKFVQRRE